MKRTRFMAVCAMLSAMAVVLQLMAAVIPKVGGFLDIEFSDLPAIIGTLALGPLCGVFLRGAALRGGRSDAGGDGRSVRADAARSPRVRFGHGADGRRMLSAAGPRAGAAGLGGRAACAVLRCTVCDDPVRARRGENAPMADGGTLSAARNAGGGMLCVVQCGVLHGRAVRDRNAAE